MDKKKHNRKSASKRRSTAPRPRGGALFLGQGQPGAKLTQVNVPRGCQFFPDRYGAWGVVETNGSMTVASANTHTYKVNAPYNLFGPQSNYSGGFSNNVPSGSFYLISGFTSTTGAIAPYNRYIVTDYTCEVTTTTSGATPNTVPVMVGISFTQAPTATSAMPVTQLPEQVRTMWAWMPPVTTAKPLQVANSLRLHDFFGVDAKQYEEQHQIYGAPAGADPLRLCYAQVWFRPADGSSNVSLNFMIRHRFRIVFTDLNVFSTNVPSFIKEHKATDSDDAVMVCACSKCK